MLNGSNFNVNNEVTIGGLARDNYGKRAWRFASKLSIMKVDVTRGVHGLVDRTIDLQCRPDRTYRFFKFWDRIKLNQKAIEDRTRPF